VVRVKEGTVIVESSYRRERFIGRYLFENIPGSTEDNHMSKVLGIIVDRDIEPSRIELESTVLGVARVVASRYFRSADSGRAYLNGASGSPTSFPTDDR
jgi:hypothetical protein